MRRGSTGEIRLPFNDSRLAEPGTFPYWIVSVSRVANCSRTPSAFFNTGSIIFDRSDPDMTKRARELSAALIRDAAKSRLAGYRGHILEMDLIAEQFDFNGHAAMRTYELLKDAMDPEGILSPGKQGIWPKALREGGKSA